MYRPKQSFLGKLIILVMAALMVVGCRKNCIPNTPTGGKNVRLLKIIDWEDSTSVPGTIPEYTVEYAGDKIVALHGSNNDSIRFEYEQNASLFPDSLNIPRGSRIIRKDNLLAFQGSSPAADTFYFSDHDYQTFRSLALGFADRWGSGFTQFLGVVDSSSGAKQFSGYSDVAAFTSTVTVQYDADGDITNVSKRTLFGESVLAFDVTVTYSTHKNNLHDIDPNLALYDPSCRGAESFTMIAPDKNMNAFPFSIQYGRKCVSTYKIEANYADSSFNGVDYTFDDKGNVTKIFINGRDFKEFVYSGKKTD